jgi:tetratricopeptide (TPR) repeat protein
MEFEAVAKNRPKKNRHHHYDFIIHSFWSIIMEPSVRLINKRFETRLHAPLGLLLVTAIVFAVSISVPPAQAQSPRMKRTDVDLGTRDLGIRYLKLGNTYRETRSYDLAQLYVKKGLDMVRNRGSRYWEAAGYEYLGLIYRDMGERDLALEYLRVAQSIFAGILNPRDGTGSDDALKLVIADIERGADRLPVRSMPPAPGPEMVSPLPPAAMPPNTEYDRLRSDNARLLDVNRQLNNRIADLEDRIRRLEQGAVNFANQPVQDISECKRDIEAIARYRESILWINNYTPVNLQVLGARVSDPNSTKINGTIITGYLKKGESVKIEMDVTPGLYAIIADGCANKARDIDVRIINQRGVVLERKDIRFTTSSDVSVEGNRIADTRTAENRTDNSTNANANVTQDRNPSTTSTQATISNDLNTELRTRPSSTREPLAKLSWNAEYSGTHTFLITMYDCEPEGAYFCFVVGRR